MTTRSTKVHLNRDFVFKCITVLLLVVAILPSYRSGYSLPTLAVMEMIFAFICFPHFYTTLARVFWPIFIYASLCFLIALPFDFKMGFMHSFMSLWIWIFPIIMSSELIKKKSFDTNRFIYFASIAILMIIIIATIKMMAENPIVMRDITAGLDSGFNASMNSQNVGGFGIAYGCGVILIALIGCLLTYKMSVTNKYIALGLAFVFGTLVVMAQFTTLLIICCAIICYQILSFKGSPNLKFLLVFGIIILGLLSKDLLALIIDEFKGTVTSYHLQEIYDSVFGNAEYDNTRAQFMSNAFNLFISSPIWGNNVSAGVNASTIYESHSTMLTILCKTGVIGLAAYLGAFWQAFKPIYNSWGTNTKKILGKSIIGYYLLLALLNPAENDIFSYCIGLVTILTVYYFSYTQIKKI